MMTKKYRLVYYKFDTLDNLRFNSNFVGDKENNKPVLMILIQEIVNKKKLKI